MFRFEFSLTWRHNFKWVKIKIQTRLDKHCWRVSNLQSAVTVFDFVQLNNCNKACVAYIMFYSV